MKITKEKGITLVALVITIIILLILAGVAISALVGDGGIISKAQNTAEEYNKSAKNEANIINELLEGIKEYQDPSGANVPKLVTGMSPIVFNSDGSTQKETKAENWYNYEQKKWANAETKDGSMWVWIPRYAYKITSGEGTSTTGTIEVVFLEGTSNQYNKNGVLTNAIDDGYKIHPSFQAARNGDYSLGQWESELTGYWVAKFEAGWQQGDAINTANNDKSKAVRSSVSYSYGGTWISAAESGTIDTFAPARNYLDGVYGVDNGGADYAIRFTMSRDVKIAYPVFKPRTYGMNSIDNSDMYNLCRALNEEGNIYGFNNNADTHMIKNSEWGAVAYLTHSKYGLDGQNIYINNVNLNNTVPSVYGVTGYAGTTADAAEVNTLSQANSWETLDGQKASSTGNIYGIYDLSGGLWEATTSYVSNGNEFLKIWDSAYAITTPNNNVEQISTKYTTVYKYNATTDSGANNRVTNAGIYGDAMLEISNSKGGTGWNTDYSGFPFSATPIIYRGGAWYDTSGAGIFSSGRNNGAPNYIHGSRAVVVAL